MSTPSLSIDDMQSLPVITPATFGAVRKMMKEEGIEPRDNEQISEYVEKLVARESFFRVVDKIQERNKEVDPKEIEAAIVEAVAEVKSQCRKQGPSADCS